MAFVRCSFCARPEGEPHSARCGVTTNGFDPHYGEFPSDIRAERDDLRRAIVEHRTAIHNAGTVRVDSRDEAAAEAKHAADERLWATPALAGTQGRG